MIDLIRDRWKYVVFVIFLSIVFKSTVLSIIGFRSSEVMYDYDVISARCLPESKTCNYTGEIKIANTGKRVADKVNIEVINMPENIIASFRTLDLVASSPREIDPTIRKHENGQSFTVTEFSPGTLILVEYRGKFSSAESEKIQDIEVVAVGSANLVKGDPHGTAFARFFSGLFLFLSLLIV